MIEFEVIDNLLILHYYPMGDAEWVFNILHKKKVFELKKTFYFKEEDLYHQEETEGDKVFDYREVVSFVIGCLDKDYFVIDKNTLGLSSNIFIYKEINPRSDFFIAHNKISIFNKINKLINEDIYVGGSNPNSIPIEVFNNLIKNYPNSYEIEKYVDARISVVLSDYFQTMIDGKNLYEKYMNNKISKKGVNIYNLLRESELNKYIIIRDKLTDMLSSEVSYNEKQWQNEILHILLLLFPKYIYVFKEVPIKDIYTDKNKRLDYLLVDSCGNVDIIEIKRPLDNCIITQKTYRENYIPMRELSGTIMQLEKYIFYLNKWGKAGENYLKKRFKGKLPDNFDIQITNPNGIIVMGRDIGLNKEQLQDFEIIKRKYKNVVDIITYDELLKRLDFIIHQLRNEIVN